ncbi:hypothetical protein FQ775_20380 [Nitratireductor mangrovi]|uniref:Uncharacterized protein n=1 Tax=Nitratireductor mangrovi TaxID=2599600 RepID=A0A5B8L3X5_9HYPH|nr:hypothetical protein [Nitratireductor mangrovi]QDZ02539.1 hypothetical protein FQ775_20380 [Nitratireductor mangrovi]
MVSELTAHRRAFWAFFADELPDLAVRTVPRRTRGNETTQSACRSRLAERAPAIITVIAV